MIESIERKPTQIFKNTMTSRKELLSYAKKLPQIHLNTRQLCDLEMLMNGSFNPLEGYLSQKDYYSVLTNARLDNGALWPIPIVFDISSDTVRSLKTKSEVALCDEEGVPLAVFHIEDIWKPDKLKEAQCIFGTTSLEHSGVSYLFNQTQEYYCGGRIECVELPKHYDIQDLRKTPQEVKEELQKYGWNRVIGFQTRNPFHRAHVEVILRACDEVQGHVLLNPVVGITKPDDIDYHTRVRCYRIISEKYLKDTVLLRVLPLAIRMAGKREALWHALIRKSYGCTHFIVGRDHAEPGEKINGDHFYEPYEAQEYVKTCEKEIGIKIIPFQEMVYCKELDRCVPKNSVPKNSTMLTLSGTEFRNLLKRGEEIPEWFSYPEVIEELRKVYVPKKEQGFTLFFTGLSGSGKSTIAKALYAKLRENGGRHVTLLDGDIVRKHLSNELGFSKEHREINVRRIGFVASEITKNGGIVLCAPIAPHEHIRQENRALISHYGAYIEVYVSTPLTICEERDRKGLYARARSGDLKDFTGISDPFEIPKQPEIVLDTTTIDVHEAVAHILYYLKEEGYIDFSI